MVQMKEQPGMFTKVTQLRSDAQVAYLLTLSETIIQKLSGSDGYEKASEALKACWDWVETKRVSGDCLYDFLDTIDETGLFILMQLEKDAVKQRVWICVVSAISYTTWKAYQERGEKYLPAPIEEVDEDFILYFIEQFHAIGARYKEISEKLLQFLLENHKVVHRESMISVIKNKKLN
jgi:hypothetical protein